MDCLIKIIAGPDAGKEFRCVAAETILGRSARSGVRLASPSVSFEHAVISRNGEGFYLENLSANGTFLNNERITGKAQLRSRDQFRIGDETMVRVESVPSTSGAAPSRRPLLVVVALLVVALVVMVVVDPFSGQAKTDWSGAYTQLQEWTAQEAADGKLPAQTPQLLQEAWRLESAGDRASAGKAWVRLRVLLASGNAAAVLAADYQQHPRALASLLAKPPSAPTPGEEEMGAALLQFIRQMERRK
jgi:pSer/pThr/pTyr-binding forkhead associated (FHA) protein